jgi:alkylation response protein AidB-like acyl-CoA dehydrogenase
MNTAPDKPQQEIARTASRFLRTRIDIARVRALAELRDEPALDGASWSAMADLGWFAAGVAEVDGGVGLGVPEQVMIFREIGRHLTPGPVLGTCVAASLLAGTTAGEPLLEGLLAGDVRCGVRAGEWVVDAHQGDLYLDISADGTSIRRLDAGEPVSSVDPGSRLTRPIASSPVYADASSAGFDRVSVLAGATLVGVIEAVRDLSTAYAKTREAFGKPIGTFQAVKHRCAEMELAAYATFSQVCLAALYLEHARPSRGFQAACAYRLAGIRARSATEDTIQNFGGIGFTAAHDAHLYLKRALLLCRLLEPALVRRALLEPARHEFD